MSSVFEDSFPLRSARVHEVCGPGATGFAAACVAQVQGPLIWIRESWRPEVLNPLGLSAFFDPARLLIAQAGSQTDALAAMEEALRDGAVRLVVIQITQPLDLREGRRLQLAARAGNTTGLCLIPEGAGSNAAETRWRADPLVDPQGGDSTLMRWRLIKNKSGTLGSWDVRWDHTARRLGLVSASGE